MRWLLIKGRTTNDEEYGDSINPYTENGKIFRELEGLSGIRKGFQGFEKVFIESERLSENRKAFRERKDFQRTEKLSENGKAFRATSNQLQVSEV